MGKFLFSFLLPQKLNRRTNVVLAYNWELTATIDPCMFLKYLCDQKETDMQLMAIKSLTNVGTNQD